MTTQIRGPNQRGPGREEDTVPPPGGTVEDAHLFDLIAQSIRGPHPEVEVLPLRVPLVKGWPDCGLVLVRYPGGGRSIVFMRMERVVTDRYEIPVRW